MPLLEGRTAIVTGVGRGIGVFRLIDFTSLSTLGVGRDVGCADGFLSDGMATPRAQSPSTATDAPLVRRERAAARFTKLSCGDRSGATEEVGEVVAFLCARRSSAIAGETFHAGGRQLTRASRAHGGW